MSEIRPNALLDAFSDRLEEALSLNATVTRALTAGDPDAIDEATHRMASLVSECRLASRQLVTIETADAASIERFGTLARRVARETAIQGGLLNGLVALSRQVLDGIAARDGAGYGADGRSDGEPIQGLHLRGTV